jgi:hypothetical protein
VIPTSRTIQSSQWDDLAACGLAHNIGFLQHAPLGLAFWFGLQIIER